MVVVKNPTMKRYATSAPGLAVKEQSRVSVKSKTLFISGIIAIILFIFLIQTTQIYLTQNRIFRLEKQLSLVKEDNNSLQLKVSELKSPDRIIPMAKSYGLIVPEEDQFIAVHYQ